MYLKLNRPEIVIDLKKVVIMLPPLLQFLTTPLPALVVGEENLVIGFGPPPL